MIETAGDGKGIRTNKVVQRKLKENTLCSPVEELKHRMRLGQYRQMEPWKAVRKGFR